MPRPERGANRGVKSKKRRAVFKLYGGRCAACGTRIRFSRMHADHVVPRAESGPHDISNLQSLCENCHMFKRGWDGRVHYNRAFKCGCRALVIRQRVLPSPRVIRHLKIKPFASAPPFQQVECCERHLRLSAAEWRKLGPICYHSNFPALSRSRFNRSFQPPSLDYSRFCWRKKKRCSKRWMNTGF
jgi:hypothetical protein